MNYHKPKAMVSVSSILVCGLVLLACAANPKPKEYDIPYDSIKMTDEKVAAFCQQSIGSMMAEIDYADDERIVFHYLNGIFVYNHQTETLEKSFDLDQLDCAHFQQGDWYAELTVSKDGKEALLVTYDYGGDIEPHDFKNYRISLENGSAEETEKTELSNPFSSFGETATNISDAEGWASDRGCVAENEDIWYLSCENYLVSGIELCRYNSGETVGKTYIFKN